MTPQQQSALTAADAAVAALAEAHRVLRASLADPVPAPTPAPTPVPAPSQATPVLSSQQIDTSRVVCFKGWHESSRYERYQRLEKWTGTQASVKIHGFNFALGGIQAALRGTRYALLVNGVEQVAVDNVKVGTKELTFTFDTSALPGGWHDLDIGGLTDGETCPKWFAYLHRPGAAAPMLMPVCTGSYDVTHNGSRRHSWAWVPTEASPKARPLAPREYPATINPQALFQTMLVPGENANIHRPNVTRDGIATAFNRQSYFWDDLIAKKPPVHLLDGPRGVGTCGLLTHIGIGIGRREDRPDSPPMLAVYCTDPWRLFRVSDSGTITTLAGYRHRTAPYFVDGPDPELVGDWSAIPEARRGFHELWGLAWDSATLAVDHSAAPDPAEQGRQPHSGNPVCVVADSQNNRICRIEFDGKSHATPAKVTELIVGLLDPWDVVEWRDEFIVSERGSDRICAYSNTGQFRRVIVQRNAALPGAAATDVNRKSRLTTGSLVDAQAQPCLRPEGLYVLDDWLYFGSRVQRLVRRAHLVTGELQTVCAPALDDNSLFIKIAVSDGSVGPQGTVFVNTWSNSSRAIGGGYLPSGERFSLTTAPEWKAWPATGYGSAVAVGGGRLYHGSSTEGIFRVSGRLPTDTPINAALYDKGQAEYEALNLRLLHGSYGFGHWGFAAPKTSAALSYFLAAHGVDD